MNKKPIIIGLIILLIGIGIGIGIGYWIWYQKKPNTILPVYFPVVIKVPKYIDKPKPYPIPIPPHISYVYMNFEDSMKLVKANDSLLYLVNNKVIQDTIKIKTGFLTAFPLQPKLINLDLKMDSLDITLFNTEEKLTTFRYPLNLFGFKYRHTGSDMSVDRLEKPYGIPVPPKWGITLTPYIGSNLISYPTINPNLSLELAISYSRVRLSLEPVMTISKYPEFGINAKIGYQVIVWPKK